LGSQQVFSSEPQKGCRKDNADNNHIIDPGTNHNRSTKMQGGKEEEQSTSDYILLCTTRCRSFQFNLPLNCIKSGIHWLRSQQVLLLQNLKKVAEKITQITIRSSTPERITTDPQKNRKKEEEHEHLRLHSPMVSSPRSSKCKDE
jgi:hypothetical protein